MKKRNKWSKGQEIKNKRGDKWLEEQVLKEKKEEYDTYINEIKSYAEKHKSDITTSQIRNIFSKIKEIHNNLNNESVEKIKRLRPLLAYTAGRNSKGGFKRFMDILDRIIKKIKTTDDVENFYGFVESILCYLKYYGDRN